MTCSNSAWRPGTRPSPGASPHGCASMAGASTAVDRVPALRCARVPAGAARACAAGAAGVRHRRPALPARTPRRRTGRRRRHAARCRAHARAGTGRDRPQRRDPGGQRCRTRAAGQATRRTPRWKCCPTCTTSPVPACPSRIAATWCSSAASAIRPMPMRCAGSPLICFPLIRARLPDVRFHCIGGDVPHEIAVLASRARRRGAWPRCRHRAVHGRRAHRRWRPCAMAPASRAR